MTLDGVLKFQARVPASQKAGSINIFAILSERGPKRFREPPKERPVLFGAEVGR
jgi:hypothetical protein